MEKELKVWSAYAREGVTVLDLVEHFVSTEEYQSRLRAAPDAQHDVGQDIGIARRKTTY
jgi:hypothetical protein